MRRFYSLIDKVYRLENLHQAYRAVRSNNGAPGVDRETVKEFGNRLDERLEEIHGRSSSPSSNHTFIPPAMAIGLDARRSMR